GRRSPRSSKGDVMRWPWQPKHTFRSGLLRIIEGLESGSVVLAGAKGPASKPLSPDLSELVRSISTVLDNVEADLRKIRALEVEMFLTTLGMWLGGVGLVIGGVVWPFWPIIVLGSVACLGSIKAIRIAQKARYHRIREEFLVALLRATPA